MLEHFPFYLILIVIILLLIMLAKRIGVAYPIVLVLAGLIISFVPGIPLLKIDPELIFIIFLPPLLYEASWAISWKELWKWRRIIASFAFIVVFLTAISVALVANYFIPGFSLALGFLLGGIVSPPDAVSAGAILKSIKGPKRLESILEGESLLNDASSLIILRFALIAVATGQFIWHEAAISFVWMVVGGTAIGLLVGYIFKKAHKFLPTDVNMDIILTLVAPYAMYIIAEQFHSSGILAVVSGGLFLSYYRHHFLTGSSRLSAENVWQSVVFVLNGLVFMLIGLDLPEIVSGLRHEGISLNQATGYGLLITLVLIIGRLLATYGAVVVTQIASHFITVADNKPGLKGPFILGWTGMRGVVSLAAALSIPLTLSDGTAFPHRNMILYITFIVILATLLLQGLTLPYLIKTIHVPTYNDYLSKKETDHLLRNELAKASMNYITQHHSAKLENDIYLKRLAGQWEMQLGLSKEESSMPEDIKKIYTKILEEQRKLLLERNNTNQEIDEEFVRDYLHYIDLEEEKMKFK
ncbi:Na+/H+ antiporter [Flavobacterium hauense]